MNPQSAAGHQGARLGAKVALIEKHLMGGDCLNVGCDGTAGPHRGHRSRSYWMRAGPGLRPFWEPRLSRRSGARHHIVASHDGDMISEFAVAMKAGAGAKTIAATIHPYPTQAEVNKKVVNLWRKAHFTQQTKDLLITLFAWIRR